MFGDINMVLAIHWIPPVKATATALTITISETGQLPTFLKINFVNFLFHNSHDKFDRQKIV